MFRNLIALVLAVLAFSAASAQESAPNSIKQEAATEGATTELTTAQQEIKAQQEIITGIANYVFAGMYVHMKKGDFVHFMFDTKARNNLPITVFQSKELPQVRFCNKGDEDVGLVEGDTHHFVVNGMDCFAIYKNHKIFIVNTVAEQFGTLTLTQTKRKGPVQKDFPESAQEPRQKPNGG